MGEYKNDRKKEGVWEEGVSWKRWSGVPEEKNAIHQITVKISESDFRRIRRGNILK